MPNALCFCPIVGGSCTLQSSGSKQNECLDSPDEQIEERKEQFWKLFGMKDKMLLKFSFFIKCTDELVDFGWKFIWNAMES